MPRGMIDKAQLAAYALTEAEMDDIFSGIFDV
jgi:hypothetical protein